MKAKSRIKKVLVAVVVAIMVALPILVIGGGKVLGNPGEVPRLMSYQGRLTNASGEPLTDGNYSIEFRLYNIATGGTADWSETQDSGCVRGAVQCAPGQCHPSNVSQNYHSSIP